MHRTAGEAEEEVARGSGKDFRAKLALYPQFIRSSAFSMAVRKPEVVAIDFDSTISDTANVTIRMYFILSIS